MTLAQAVREVADALATAGVDAPALSARLLAGQVLGLAREDILLQGGRPLTPDERSRLQNLAQRRGRGEPLAYILGRREFYGLDFAVSPAVLIPRPDTETLIDAVRRNFRADAPLAFADIGTGSGCIGITLATLFPESRGLLVDVSAEALAVARANAMRHGVLERLTLSRADLRILELRPGNLDLLASNPPYIASDEYAALDREVRDFEPQLALNAGPQGIEPYASLARLAGAALKPGGLAALEIGWRQGAAVSRLLAAAGLARVAVQTDLAGHDRVVLGMQQARGRSDD